MPARGAVTSSRQTGKNSGSTDPANGLTNECIGEASTFRGEAVDGGRLDQGMAIASEGTRGLIVGKEEDDVGLLGHRS